MLDKLEKLEALMPHGRIPKELLSSIQAIYNEDEDRELAGQVAIAAIEYALTGDTSFYDDRNVMRELRHYKDTMNHNLDSYTFSCEETMINNEYERIAEMYWGRHMTQTAIGKEIGATQQIVSKRLRAIRDKYPDIYNKYNT